MSKTRRRKTRVSDMWKDGSVGRGRSKPIYIEPTRHDTAVLIPFFNPAAFKRPLKNILYVMHTLKEVGIPCYVAECAMFGREPEVVGANLVVRSNSAMFYKEQLINLLEKRIPEKYTKLVIMDSDIIFSSPNWLDQISKKLDGVDIIQPFASACWLFPDNTRIHSKKYSYAYAIANGKFTNTVKPNVYHPGFVWAMKRSTFRAIGGLYDKAIAGNGDVMFAFSLMNALSPEYINRYAPCILDTWNTYNDKVRSVGPTVSYISIDVYHLFHGLSTSRQYVSRHNIINGPLTSGWDVNISVNADGLYEFKDKKISDKLLTYFKGRNEDISLEAAKASQINLYRETLKN